MLERVAAAVEGIERSGCDPASSEAGGGATCTVVEVERAITGIGRLAEWELAAVEHVLSVCGVNQK